jgi:hypothetical protein
MDQLCALASAFLDRLLDLSEFLFGCSHRRTSFPMTLRASAGVDGKKKTQSETCVVCLDCARRFSYNWATMQRGRQSPPKALKARLTANGFHISPLNSADGLAAIGKP